MNSMTGFGSYETVHEEMKLRVDVKSVNHKNLDICIKGLAENATLEQRIKSSIAESARRGHFEVFVHVESDGKADLIFVPEAYAFYEAILHAQGGSQRSEVAWLLEQPGVIRQGTKDIEKVDEAFFMEVFHHAFSDLSLMRKKEGENLKKTLEAHIATLNEYVKHIEAATIKEKAEEKEWFKRRVDEISGTYAVDLPRFSTELALLFEKISIDEEIARLISHIDQFNVIMNDKGSVGRRLDFLLQEMFREANTISSKSRHIGILHDIVEVKTLIDDLREQVANIE